MPPNSVAEREQYARDQWGWGPWAGNPNDVAGQNSWETWYWRVYSWIHADPGSQLYGVEPGPWSGQPDLTNPTATNPTGGPGMPTGGAGAGGGYYPPNPYPGSSPVPGTGGYPVNTNPYGGGGGGLGFDTPFGNIGIDDALNIYGLLTGGGGGGGGGGPNWLQYAGAGGLGILMVLALMEANKYSSQATDLFDQQAAAAQGLFDVANEQYQMRLPVQQASTEGYLARVGLGARVPGVPELNATNPFSRNFSPLQGAQYQNRAPSTAPTTGEVGWGDMPRPIDPGFWNEEARVRQGLADQMGKLGQGGGYTPAQGDWGTRQNPTQNPNQGFYPTPGAGAGASPMFSGPPGGPGDPMYDAWAERMRQFYGPYGG